jgi:ribosomal-protein-alanine N-acetyltransferase
VSAALETPRLVLRPFEPADAGAALAVYGDPEVMRHVGEGLPADAERVAATLRAYAEHQATRGFSFWAVVERTTGELVGDAGLYVSGAHGDEVELGYTLARRVWGRGYATEAARAWVDAAFAVHGLDVLVAVADLENPASSRVLEKAGLRRAGVRQAYGRAHALHRLDRATWAAGS